MTPVANKQLVAGDTYLVFDQNDAPHDWSLWEREYSGEHEGLRDHVLVHWSGEVSVNEQRYATDWDESRYKMFRLSPGAEAGFIMAARHLTGTHAWRKFVMTYRERQGS